MSPNLAYRSKYWHTWSGWSSVKGVTFICRMERSSTPLCRGLRLRGTHAVAAFVPVLKCHQCIPDSFMLCAFAHRGNHKVEDACEMYARAANMFKMAKNWSGRWRVRAHFVHRKLMLCHKKPKQKLFMNIHVLQMSKWRRNWLQYVTLACLCVFSCWECILPGCSASHAAAKQAGLGHEFCRRWQRLQESRPTGWAQTYFHTLLPHLPLWSAPSIQPSIFHYYLFYFINTIEIYGIAALGSLFQLSL